MFSDPPIAEEKLETEIVIELFAEGVGKMKNVEHKKCLLLPTNIPKTLEHYCNVIQISYELKVGAESKTLPIIRDIVFPITIGSIAIGGEFQTSLKRHGFSNSAENSICK